jgi:hypothetical protein
MTNLRRVSLGLLALLVGLMVLVTPVTQDHPSSAVAAGPPAWIEATIHEAGDYHGVNGYKLVELAGCETGYTYNPAITGPSAWPVHERLYVGLFQFDWKTFKDSPYYSSSEDLRYDVWSSAMATAWYIKIGTTGRGEPGRWPHCGYVAGFL